MQLLNISVNNRPSHSVTSKPYGYYLDNVFQGSMQSINVISKDIMIYHKIDIALDSILVPSLQITKETSYYQHTTSPEYMASTLTAVGLQITKSTTYTVYGLRTESMVINLNSVGLVITKQVQYLAYHLNYNLGCDLNTISIKELL